MELKNLRSLWQIKNPSGNIWIIDSNGNLFDEGRQTGKFAVTYKSDGKIYTYSYKSIYKLAERLQMIPDNNLDYWIESRKAIEAMNQGKSFISICGLSDTIRYILGNNDTDKKDVSVEYKAIGLDIYDRQQYEFISYKIN